MPVEASCRGTCGGIVRSQNNMYERSFDVVVRSAHVTNLRPPFATACRVAADICVVASACMRTVMANSAALPVALSVRELKPQKIKYLHRILLQCFLYVHIYIKVLDDKKVCSSFDSARS